MSMFYKNIFNEYIEPYFLSPLFLHFLPMPPLPEYVNNRLSKVHVLMWSTILQW